jgi:alpha-L-arabinofuranosidase
MKTVCSFLVYLVVFAWSALAQSAKVLTVQVNRATATIEPTMYGVFFEDINFGADGGIYAELIKNRSFEFSKPLMGWKVEQKPFREGAVTIQNRQQKNTSNPRFLRVQVTNADAGNLTMTNEGFRGMGVKKGLRYDFSCMYRQAAPGVKLQISLLSTTGNILATAYVIPKGSSNEWQKATVSFHATLSDPKAVLSISFVGSGTIDLDMISLFPEDTWKQRPGGMRADMIQMLAGLKPGFIRFPGGCIVEGFDLNNRYQWKKTIGPIEERQLIMNRWNVEFVHRPAPDYFQTFGLGFFEYFQLAEDIGAEALPILNCGMACQFNSAEVVALDQIDPYVQDALDLIEFANGNATSTWGKIRVDMGHPQPFNLKFLGVGNENWGPQYVERLKVFQKAIKAKYPNMQIVASSGTDPNGERFDFLNQHLRSMQIDLIDEHYYRKPEWFLNNASRYDNYPRNGIKIFAGEYAAHSDNKLLVEKRNNWLAALSEAAFLTGLERNADVVKMASYAPLFSHAEAWQWNPDLIWVNNTEVVGSPSYEVQKLFSLNKGHRVVPIMYNNSVLAGQDSLYATASIDTVANELIVKVVNTLGSVQNLAIQLEGVKKVQAEVHQIVLQNDDLMAYNSFGNNISIAPKEGTKLIKREKLEYQAMPYSVTFLKIKMK